MAKGESWQGKNDVLKAAQNSSFKHASPYDFKLTLNEKSKLDVSKSFRMPLIYLCGGLDFEALAYSVLKAFEKNIKSVIDFNKQKAG